jgi:Holliday junction resolvasome RuvABC endonuclease subunit
MIILGIDLGTRGAWSALDRAGLRQGSGRWDLTPQKATKSRPPEHRAVRWQGARSKFTTILQHWRPEAIAFERPVGRSDGGGRATFIVHGAMLAMLELAAFELDPGLPFIPLSPSEWKLAMVGHGSAKKPAYIAAANARYGLHFAHDTDKAVKANEDEAAALLIAGAAIQLGKVGGVTARHAVTA